jgi:hypothetical protein
VRCADSVVDVIACDRRHCVRLTSLRVVDDRRPSHHTRQIVIVAIRLAQAACLGARSASIWAIGHFDASSARFVQIGHFARTIAIADLPGTATRSRNARPERTPVSTMAGVQTATSGASGIT